jgi:hypothetical protein
MSLHKQLASARRTAAHIRLDRCMGSGSTNPARRPAAGPRTLASQYFYPAALQPR